jgi:hypothetical protein
MRLHVIGMFGSVLFARTWAVDDEGRAWAGCRLYVPGDRRSDCQVPLEEYEWKRVPPSKEPKSLRHWLRDNEPPITIELDGAS